MCNKYNTCILTTVLMYYTIFIVAGPYSQVIDSFLSLHIIVLRAELACYFLPLTVTYYPTAGVKVTALSEYVFTHNSENSLE